MAGGVRRTKYPTLAALREGISSHINMRAFGLRDAEYGRLERYSNGRSSNRGPRTFRSSPGDSPAAQSRRLMESIGVLEKATPEKPTAVVGPNPERFDHPYPYDLENGTRHMKARPFVGPAVEDFKESVK